MTSWQKRARAGVAIFGLAVAVIVYFALRQREAPAPAAPIQRSDPKAIAEITGGAHERVVFTQKNFSFEYDVAQAYEDGSMKYTNVRVKVPKGENRTFSVTAKEAAAGKDEDELGLTGEVKLEDSDGFVLTTQRGTYKQKDAIAHAPGAVSFSKGRMSGSGVGISYDQGHDLLVIGSYVQIATKDEAGNPFMEFTAGSAMLDRVRHLLTLDTDVHVMRGGQIIEADHVEAQLSSSDDIVTYIAMRGNSHVEGGGSSIDALSARDINLDYTKDGTRLELVDLMGEGAATMTGENGGAGRQIIGDTMRLELAEDKSTRMWLYKKASIVTAAEGGRPGRTIAAEVLEISLAPDGSITRAIGRDEVKLELPNPSGGPARSIRTRQLEGKGVAGQGLTSATFNGDVRFTEQAGKTTAARTVRAQKLEAAMAGDAVNAATFTGDVTFEETGLKACAGRLEYQPEKGTLQLSGTTPAGSPTVAEEQVNIEGQTIDVTLQAESRRIVAKGGVTTRMGAGSRCKPGTERAAGQRGATRLPGLLDAKTAVTVRAGTLDYDSGTGKAVYTGVATNQASITQGTTAILADAIVIDQSTGDLTATGNAIVEMALDSGSSTGSAHEIRYVDAMRVITYSAPPTGYIAPVLPPGVKAFREPQLQIPQGNVTAGTRITVTLAKDAPRAEQIDARTNVSIKLGTGLSTRTASGGLRLLIDPPAKKYVMTAGGTTLVKIVERSGTACREFTGRSLTFYETGDTIDIDGKQINRTQTTSTACAPSVR
jgi:lipopolysaccharide export system protein LptA